MWSSFDLARDVATLSALCISQRSPFDDNGRLAGYQTVPFMPMADEG